MPGSNPSVRDERRPVAARQRSLSRGARTRGRRARHVSAAVTKPDVGRGESHTFPQFLPDGVHFLYLARSQGTPRVFVGSLDGRASRHVLDANARVSYADPGFCSSSATMARCWRDGSTPPGWSSLARPFRSPAASPSPAFSMHRMPSAAARSSMLKPLPARASSRGSIDRAGGSAQSAARPSTWVSASPRMEPGLRSSGWIRA